MGSGDRKFKKLGPCILSVLSQRMERLDWRAFVSSGPTHDPVVRNVQCMDQNKLEIYLKSFKEVCGSPWSDDDTRTAILRLGLQAAIEAALDGHRLPVQTQPSSNSASQDARSTQPPSQASAQSSQGGSRQSSPTKSQQSAPRAPIVAAVIDLEDVDEVAMQVDPVVQETAEEEQLEEDETPVELAEEEDYSWLDVVLPRVRTYVALPSQEIEDPESLRSDDSGLKFGSEESRSDVRPTTPEVVTSLGSGLSKQDSDLVVTGIITKSMTPTLHTTKTEITYPMPRSTSSSTTHTITPVLSPGLTPTSSGLHPTASGLNPTTNGAQYTTGTSLASAKAAAADLPPPPISAPATEAHPAEIEERKVKPKKNDPAFAEPFAVPDDAIAELHDIGAEQAHDDDDDDDPLRPEPLVQRLQAQQRARRPPPEPASSLAPPAKRSAKATRPVLPAYDDMPEIHAGPVVDIQLFAGPGPGMTSRMPTPAERAFLRSLEVPPKPFHLPPYNGRRMASLKAHTPRDTSMRMANITNWMAMVHQQSDPQLKKKREEWDDKREVLMVIDADFAYTENGSGVIESLQALQCPVTTAKLPCRNTIIWRRRGFEYELKSHCAFKSDRDDPAYPLTEYNVELDHFILILTPEQWAACHATLDSPFIREAKHLNPGKAMSVMILHPKNNWKYGNLTMAHAADISIGMQLKHDIKNMIVETAAKFQYIAINLFQWTRALAFRQYEFLKEDHMDGPFLSRDVGQKDLVPAKDPHLGFKGILAASGLSAPAINSIASIYPNGSALIRGYQALPSTDAKERMLASVRTSSGPLGVDRTRPVYNTFGVSADHVPGNETYVTMRRKRGDPFQLR